MPQNVRNFWIETTVDGQRTPPKGQGPQSKDGGFRTVVLMRDDGDVTRVLEMEGYVRNGNLCLRITPELRRQKSATSQADVVVDGNDIVITTQR